MRSHKKAPSERFVSAVVSFIAGQHLYGKPRPSTLELMLDSFRLRRQVKDLSKKYGLDKKETQWTR
jgi:hypothetical protein